MSFLRKMSWRRFMLRLSFAQSLSVALPMMGLSRALQLGKLGEQTVLVSDEAFEMITFVDAVPVAREQYYPKFWKKIQKQEYHLGWI